MPIQYHRILLPALVVTVVLTIPAPAFAQKLKIGNGALLRKMFGGRDDEDSDREKTPEKAKPTPAEQPEKRPWYDFENKQQERRPETPALGRETFDDVRRKLEEDTRRLQEDLRNKFKSPFAQNQPEPNNAAANGRLQPTSPRPLSSPPNASAVRSVMDPRARNGIAPDSNQPLLRPGTDYSASLGPQNQPRVTAESRRATTPVPRSAQPLPGPQDNPSSLLGSGEGPGFGVTGQALSAGGIKVISVQPDSVAAMIGIRPNDVLENVAGLEISETQEIDAITNVLQGDDQFEIGFRRAGRPQTKMISGSLVASSRMPAGATPPAPAFDSQNQPQMAQLQQQLQQQQLVIQQLRAQLQRQQSAADSGMPARLTAPQTSNSRPALESGLRPPTRPSNSAPPALENDFDLELNLEPPRG